MKFDRVDIVNPRNPSKRYTSLKSAREYVERGHAVFISDEKLEFIDRATQVVASQDLSEYMARCRQEAEDTQIVSDRKGVIWWNGCDRRELAMHRPGESPMFRRPDSGLR